jgi:hypothetical protein
VVSKIWGYSDHPIWGYNGYMEFLIGLIVGSIVAPLFVSISAHIVTSKYDRWQARKDFVDIEPSKTPDLSKINLSNPEDINNGINSTIQKILAMRKK